MSPNQTAQPQPTDAPTAQLAQLAQLAQPAQPPPAADKDAAVERWYSTLARVVPVYTPRGWNDDAPQRADASALPAPDYRPPVRRPAPVRSAAQRPPHALRPAPVRPHELIISATIRSASAAGIHPAVLLAHDAGTIYLDTRAGRIELPASAGTSARSAALAPGRIVIARRDALSLAEWRRTLSE